MEEGFCHLDIFHINLENIGYKYDSGRFDITAMFERFSSCIDDAACTLYSKDDGLTCIQ